MNFLYTTLYSLDDILLAHQQEAANCQSFLSRPVRKFVLEIVLKLEQEEIPQTPLGRNPVGKLLTSDFIQLDHQVGRNFKIYILKKYFFKDVTN